MEHNSTGRAASSRLSRRLVSFFLAIFSLVNPTVAYPCSALAGLQDGQALVGGNYDWYARGGQVFVSPRGQVKSAALIESSRAATWTSKYASLTLSQFGRDYPMQGMNEAGLAGMVLLGPAEYPADGGEGVVTENLWLQYQLDRYESVKEVATHAGDLGVVKLSAPLHWFFCDASAECVVVEFLQGRAVVHTGSSLPVPALTNTGYERAISSYEQWRRSNAALPGGYESLARFIRLGERLRPRGGESYLSDLKEGSSGDAIWDLAAALDDVAKEGFTAWQTVFDSSAKTIRVRLDGGVWTLISFDQLDLRCGARPLTRDIGTAEWVDYDHDAVARMFTQAARGASGLTPEIQERVLRASESVRCEGGRSDKW